MKLSPLPVEVAADTCSGAPQNQDADHRIASHLEWSWPNRNGQHGSKGALCAANGWQSCRQTAQHGNTDARLCAATFQDLRVLVVDAAHVNAGLRPRRRRSPIASRIRQRRESLLQYDADLATQVSTIYAALIDGGSFRWRRG